MEQQKIRAGIIGVTGYTGGELIRLLLQHPKAELIALFRLSSEEAVPIHKAQPHLRGLTKLDCVPYDEKLLKGIDALFLALPNGVSMELAPKLLEKGIKVIDLSADFRFRNPETYERWYRKTHIAQNLLSEVVYGVPELRREQIRKAFLVANPGCYPISALLALAPLLRRRLIQLDSIIIDSKSGVSGAGRSRLEASYLFTELDEDFRAYGVASHRHIPEMEQEFSDLVGESVRITFTPHLVPMVRGIFTTAYAKLAKPMNLSDVHALYAEDYAKEPFVRVLDIGELPRIKAVVGSNFCDISVVVDERTQRAIVLSVIDNLVKGASGNAVQCFNLMFGLDERTGLWHGGLAP
ncbi:MAG: N-acetyl-gamma-glutamyl-phosphate reductase [Armatimonadetes bacterium]|nr:N-acetyl-gamma-glutamyl-phosphate reductase [Armatimonadota bacterium]